jgi:hypothetical protein
LQRAAASSASARENCQALSKKFDIKTFLRNSFHRRPMTNQSPQLSAAEETEALFQERLKRDPFRMRKD